MTDIGKDSSEEATPAGEADRKSGADLARDAMARARASAKQRGAYRTSPTAARVKRATKRRESQPFSGGRDPLTMNDAVDSLLRRMGWTEQIEVSGVIGRWREVVGDHIADHCEPLGFDEGILTVKATSTAWATQLAIMSGQIRHRINEEFGRDIVREIKVAGPTTRSWVKGPRTVKGRGPRDTYG
jgi:predicted nucleic acid-binding Zn ribbon protein